MENTQFKIKLKKKGDLKILKIFKQSDYLQLNNCAIQDKKLCISATKLKDQIDDKQFEIISIINNLEAEIPFKVHRKLPHKTFELKSFKPNFNKKYVIICNKGVSSYDITLKIKGKYPDLEVFSLTGGIENY